MTCKQESNSVFFYIQTPQESQQNELHEWKQILSVANCFRMAFWPHWITAGPSLDTANTDGSSNSVNRAHGFSEVPELIPAGSSRVVCNKVALHYLYSTLPMCGWVPHLGSTQCSGTRTTMLRRGPSGVVFLLSCWQQMPRKSIRMQQAYNDASHT